MGLRVQGICYQKEGSDNGAKLKRYSSDFLMDLAGNAFHAGCCVATIIATYTALATAASAVDVAAEDNADIFAEEDRQVVDEAALDAAINAAWGP